MKDNFLTDNVVAKRKLKVLGENNNYIKQNLSREGFYSKIIKNRPDTNRCKKYC